jgi:uncharacterized protein (TIGR02001 family)
MKQIIVLAILVLMFSSANAQTQESPWHAGVDVYNTYVFRGAKFGNGPSIQPSFNYSKSGFTLGAWGAYSTSSLNSTDPFIETDLYATYSVKLCDKSSLSFSVIDYYFPSEGIDYFHVAHHCFEPTLTFNYGKLSLLSAYMLKTKDLYNELSINLSNVSIFVGAGNKVYTKDAKYSLCNVGIKTVKTLKISDSFSIPLTGGVVLNPSTEQFHIVVGISL